MTDRGVRLGTTVLARRRALGRTRADVQMRSRRGGGKGLSQEAIRAIERNERDKVQANTARALEAGLDWPAGYVDQILDGTAEPIEDEPVEVGEDNPVAGLFGFLGDDQRRALLRGVRAWVDDNPAYAGELDPVAALEGEDVTDAELAEVRRLLESLEAKRRKVS